MSVDEAITAFSSFSPPEKGEFLARLSHELTIVARDSYEAEGEGFTNPQRVRRINEVQHRVSGFLNALLRDDPRRYPDETLVRIVLEQPDDPVLERQLREAFARLASHHVAVT